MSCDLQRIWTCQVCTFDNSDMHSQACGVCNNPNPLKCWACSACSFQNSEPNLEACTICHSPRHPVAAPSAGASLQSLHAEIAGAQKEEQEMLAVQEARANLQQLLHKTVVKIMEAMVYSFAECK